MDGPSANTPLRPSQNWSRCIHTDTSRRSFWLWSWCQGKKIFFLRHQMILKLKFLAYFGSYCWKNYGAKYAWSHGGRRIGKFERPTASFPSKFNISNFVSKLRSVSKWHFRKHESGNNVQLKDWKSKNWDLHKKENDELLNSERYVIPEVDRK